MISSRAGLETSSLYRSGGAVAAVLLLFLTLLAPIVHAAPVASHSVHSLETPAVPIFTSADNTISGGRNGMAMIAQNRAQSMFTVDSSYAGLRHSHSSIHSSSPEFPRREEEIVVLVRRKSIAAKIRDAFHKLGHKIKHAFQKVGHAIKHAFQKVGQGIKHAAQKVGHFFKTTGAKIAKVALKIGATIGKIASKVVGFIPGVGKVLGKAMEGASEGMNKASDAIHAHIGGKLGQAMKRMDKAQKVVGYIP